MKHVLSTLLVLLLSVAGIGQVSVPGMVRFPGAIDDLDSLFGRLTDGPESTLSSTITSDAATITVVGSGAAAFGSSGSIRIDSEWIYYTGKTTNTFTGCLRGREGTTATTHISGSKVKSPVGSAHHRALAEAIIAVQDKVQELSAIEAVVSFNGRGGAVVFGNDDLPANVSVSGSVSATNFIGNGASITGLSAACSSGSCSGTSAPGALSLIADNDSVGGDGIIDMISAGVTLFRMNADGSAQFMGTANAGLPDDVLIGSFSVGSGTGPGGRVRLASHGSIAPVSFFSQAYGLANGPPGALDYIDQTFAIAYNTLGGAGIDPNDVSFSLSHESKYRNGTRGDAGGFQTEIYYAWSSPGGSINIRPWGFDVQHDTGVVHHGIQGQIDFLRNPGNGGGRWGRWFDDGSLDLTEAPNGVIAFKNNAAGLRWGNAAGDNSLNPLHVDNLNRTVLGVGGGGSDVYVESNNMTAHTILLDRLANINTPSTFFNYSVGNAIYAYVGNVPKWSTESAGLRMISAISFDTDNTHDIGMVSFTPFRPKNVHVGTDVYLGGVLRIGGVPVVSARGAAVADPTGGSVIDVEGRAALATLLLRLRTHGLIAP